MVIDSWEAIELEFARTYSVFHGDPDGTSVNDYGKPTVFSGRIAGLRNAASNTFFPKAPNQNHEGEFTRLTVIAERFADRRNEVAHGFVLPVEGMTYFRELMNLRVGRRRHYLLIPPIYTARKHVEGLPSYAYSYPTMVELSKRIGRLWVKIEDFRKEILGRQNWTPPIRSAPR